MIAIATGVIGTITTGMIGTITIETTDTIDTNEFLIYSGPEKNRNEAGGVQMGVADARAGIGLPPQERVVIRVRGRSSETKPENENPSYRLVRLTNLAAKNPSISFWGGKVLK